jgi:hypothetical protein
MWTPALSRSATSARSSSTRRAASTSTADFVFGAQAFVWGTTSVTIRQRAVPVDLQGRGGEREHRRDVRRPGHRCGARRAARPRARRHGAVLFAFIGSAVFVVLIWGQLAHVSHADEAMRPRRPDDRRYPRTTSLEHRRPP